MVRLVNPALERLSGRLAAGILGRPVEAQFHPEDGRQLTCWIIDLLSTGDPAAWPHDSMLELLHASGARIPVRCTACSEFVEGLPLLSVHIEDRRQLIAAEARASTVNEELDAVFEDLDACFVRVDAGWHIQRMSAAAHGLLGWPTETVAGAHRPLLIEPERYLLARTLAEAMDDGAEDVVSDSAQLFAMDSSQARVPCHWSWEWVPGGGWFITMVNRRPEQETDAALHELESHFSRIVNSSTDSSRWSTGGPSRRPTRRSTSWRATSRASSTPRPTRSSLSTRVAPCGR